MNILHEHYHELDDLAAQCGIDWSKVSDFSPGMHKNPPVISKKYKRSTFYYIDYRIRSDQSEYLRITFHTKKNGGMTLTWRSTEKFQNDQRFYEAKFDHQKPVDERESLKEIENENGRKKFEKFKAAFEKAPRASQHPYLEKKGLKVPEGVFDLRILSEFDAYGEGHRKHKNLAFPLYNLKGQNVGFQKIAADGSKFLTHGWYDGSYKGAHTVLGKIKDSDTIYVAEGFATGLTIHQSLGVPVVIAGWAHNLETVMKHFDNKYKNSKVVCLADNDVSGSGNTGIFFALKAARSVRGRIIYPPAINGKKTDWNDFAKEHGNEALREYFSKEVNYGVPKREYKNHLFDLLQYAPNGYLEKIIRQICSAEGMPYCMSIEEIGEKVNDVLGERAEEVDLDLDQIYRSIRYSVMSKAAKLSQVSNRHISEKHLYELVKNESGHFVIPEEAISKSISLMEEGKKVFFRAPMGSGKTERLIKRVFERSDRGAYIAPRCSIVEDASTRLNIGFYKDICEEEINVTDKMASTEQSLSAERFRSDINGEVFFEKVDTFVCDEFTQSLSQIPEIGLDHTRKVMNFEIYKNCISSVDKFLAAEATISDAYLEQVKKMAPDCEIAYIECNYPADAWVRKKLKFTDAALEIIVEIEKSIAKDEKVFVSTDTKAAAKKLIRHIKHLHPNVRELLVCKSPETVKAAQDFCKNPNEEAQKYDLVICTPKVSSGVSITTGYFDRMFGIFTGVVSPVDLMQMLGRVRAAENWHVSIDEIKRFRNFGSRAPAYGKLGAAMSEYTEFCEDMEEIKLSMRDNYLVTALSILEVNGWEIEKSEGYGKNPDKGLKKLWRQLGEEVKKDRVEKVGLQPELTEKGAQRLQRLPEISFEDECALVAHEIRTKMGYEPNERTITFRDKGGLDWIANLESAKTDDKSIGKFERIEERSVDTYHRYFPKHRKEIFWKVVESLGLDKGLGGEWNRMEGRAARDYLFDNADVANLLFPATINPERPGTQPLSALRRFFSHFGLRIDTRRSHGRTYCKINPESLAEMNGYLAARKKLGVETIPTG
ncbi:MAG: toprim domain-containing protein [Pseudobacteriovorax sp.]|nr:toprim domain-containing protein [Pseudobacteriovorax sp.]